MNILFWNLGGRAIGELLAAAVHERDVDVIVLAECEIGRSNLADALNHDRAQTFVPVGFLPHRVQIFSRLPAGTVEPVQDEPGITIHRVRPLRSAPFLLVGVHLPSQRHHTPADLNDLIPRLAQSIRAIEQREGHARTVVVGDFNLDPFERGIAGSEGLHAVMDRRIAKRGSRTAQWVEREFFYNPMWSRLGDASAGPPGTHYYAHNKALAYFWHTFDQVLIRPALLDQFDSSSLAILTSVGDTSLVRATGIPNDDVGSDHLPLLFSLSFPAAVTEAIL